MSTFYTVFVFFGDYAALIDFVRKMMMTMMMMMIDDFTATFVHMVD
jgi:hypothetical protein